MLKCLKRFALLCLTLCLAVGAVAALVGCGDTPEDKKVSYQVNVTCQDEPVLLSLVTVQLLDQSGKSVTEAKKLTNGSVTFELESGEYTVKLEASSIGADKAYDYDHTAKVTASNPKTTVAITRTQENKGDDTAKTYTYQIKVTLPDGSPVSGASVQLCLGEEFCVLPVSSGADGIATFHLEEEGAYDIHILSGIPSGYKFDGNKFKTGATAGLTTVQLDAEN